MSGMVRAMSDIAFIDRPGGARLAYRHLIGTTPTLVFLPGYMSDMAGGKASALFDWARREGRACLLLDYASCGESAGDFADQALTDWRDDVVFLIDRLVAGPVVLVGSSMGGWLMLLVALALDSEASPGRVAGLIGIAAAPDFTDWGFSAADKATIREQGRLEEATPYSDDPYVTTRSFWESGEANRLLDAPIALDCPVRLLHGQRDADVPWQLSLRLAERLRSADVQVSLVKHGDHRLSRDGDIALMLGTVAALLADLERKPLP